MSNPKHFNDEHDFTNDDGYLDDLLDSSDIRQEWLDEEEEYWSENNLDPADEDNYDGVEGSENDESADTLDRYDEDFDWDDEESDRDLPAGYNDWNDSENY